MTTDNQKGRILAVDDQPITLKVISRFLSDEGFDLVTAQNGRDALEIFEKDPNFDMLILDVMMPKMDGYQLCQRIREQFSLFEMPVLFLTAKANIKDMAEGFDAGANDFIRKPFEKEELIIRSKTLIRLKNLTSANKVLEEAIYLKNRFIEMYIHDLKNPLTSIIALSDMLSQDDTIARNNQDVVNIITHSSQLMLKLVEKLLLSSRIESGKVTLVKESLNINDILQEAIIDNERSAVLKEQTITFYPETESPPIVFADRLKLRQVIENLISNAIKYSPYRSKIEIKVERNVTYVRFMVKDFGQGLSEEDKANVFHRFNRLSALPTGGESSSGIGLSIAKDLVELHNGKIWVESNLDEGSCFTVELPVEKND